MDALGSKDLNDGSIGDRSLASMLAGGDVDG